METDIRGDNIPPGEYTLTVVRLIEVYKALPRHLPYREGLYLAKVTGGDHDGKTLNVRLPFFIYGDPHA